MTFEQLVAEAQTMQFSGWDFSVLDGRYVENKPSWDYREIVRARLRSTSSLLDLGTGGGEFLTTLAPLPSAVSATEGWAPNVPVARQALEPLGIRVVDTTELGDEQTPLPFDDNSFDLIINRHESYDPNELRRILALGGHFVTQQVGAENLTGLNRALDGSDHPYPEWDASTAATGLSAAGFTITDQREEYPPAAFHDIGAVVLYLRLVPWQIPDFDSDRYDAQLRRLHDTMADGSPFEVTSHRFLIIARA